jgi:hypothetical protein
LIAEGPSDWPETGKPFVPESFKSQPSYVNRWKLIVERVPFKIHGRLIIKAQGKDLFKIPKIPDRLKTLSPYALYLFWEARELEIPASTIAYEPPCTCTRHSPLPHNRKHAAINLLITRRAFPNGSGRGQKRSVTYT